MYSVIGPSQGMQHPGVMTATHPPQRNGFVHNLPQSDQNSEIGNQERKNQMELSLSRSITLVIWYKASISNGDPIRLHHEIPTFPLFQLSHFPSLVSDLGLSQTSYIDTYNPSSGHWEQHMITTVRAVEREQRLLYKIRKHLLEGLNDDECAGLSNEVATQPSPKQAHTTSFSIPLNNNGPSTNLPNGNLKRPAADPAESSPATKYFIADAYAGHQGYNLGQYATPSAQAYPQSLSTPTPTSSSPPKPPSASSSPASPTSPNQSRRSSQPSTSTTTPPQSNLSTPQTQGPIPYHPHPPLKRWPNDYTVSEIAAGFGQMDNLIAQTPSSTQRAAFERVFGCRYVKSTVCRHRGVWRRADPSLRDKFEAMGSDERAVWGEFVRRIEGRPSTKAGSMDDALIITEQGILRQKKDTQSARPMSARGGIEEEDEEGGEVRMTPIGQAGHMSMQQAGQVSLDNATQINGMHDGGHLNVYDPVLTNVGQTLQS